MPPLWALEEDAKITLQNARSSVDRVRAEEIGLAADGTDIDLVTLEWDPPADQSVDCVAVYVRRPGEDFTPQAAAILPPANNRFELRPFVTTGEYCIKLVALTATSRGVDDVHCSTVEKAASISIGHGPEILSSRPDRSQASLGWLVAGGTLLFGVALLTTIRRRFS